MVNQATTRRLSPCTALGALALTVLALFPSQVDAQEPLRWSQDLPGNSKPITLYADDVFTWVEQGQRVIVLKGRVWVEQGFVHIRLPQGVAWVDEEQKRRTGVDHVELYGEGGVTVEDGPKTVAGARAVLELNTRGEIRLKSYRGKVVQEPAPADPLHLRAVAVKHNLAAVVKPAPPPATIWRPSGGQRGAEKRATDGPPPAALPLEQRPSAYQSGVLPPPPPPPAEPIRRTSAVEPVVPGPPGSPAPQAAPAVTQSANLGPPLGPVPITPVQQGAPGPPGPPPSNMQPGGPGPVPTSPPGSVFPGPTIPDTYPPPGPAVPPVPPRRCRRPLPRRRRRPPRSDHRRATRRRGCLRSGRATRRR